MILVTSYTNADIDGTACAIAYAELLVAQGKEAVSGIAGTPHVEARHVLAELGVSVSPLPIAHDVAVVVDMCRYYKIDPSVRAEEIIEVIDHRQGGLPEEFPHVVTFQVELVGAAATLVYERWRDAGMLPDPVTSRLLQAAIVSNTVNFKAGVTTERDHAAFDALSAAAPLSEGFIHRMFAAKSDLSGPALAESMHGDMTTFDIGDRTANYFQLEISGGDALLAERDAEIRGMLAAASADEVMLTVIDIEEGVTHILAPDPRFADIISKALACRFDERGRSLLERPTMRKEIRPKIEAYYNQASHA